MGQRWAEMRTEGKEQGGVGWGTKKPQKQTGKGMEWRDREEERDKAEMGREVDAEWKERDRERKSEPQRTEEGSTEKQTKGVGKGKKAHSGTWSGRRPRQSSRDVQGGGSTSTSPRHPQPAPGSGPLDMFLHRTPEACKAVAWAVSPRSASQEAQTLPRVTVAPVLQAELKPPSCLVQAPSPRRSISGFSVPHTEPISVPHT